MGFENLARYENIRLTGDSNMVNQSNHEFLINSHLLSIECS